MVLAGLIPFMLFVGVITFLKDFIFASIAFFAGLILVVLFGRWLLSHPFFSMLDGKDFLGLVVDSSAVIKPINVRFNQPFVSALLSKAEKIETSYDRDNSNYLAIPRNGYYGIINDHYVWTLPKSQASDHDLEFEGKTTFLINGQKGTFISKKFLMEQEKTLFSENQIEYVAKLLDEEGVWVRKYCQTWLERVLNSPAWQNVMKWGLILMVLLVIVGLVVFWPDISQLLGFSSPVGPPAPPTPVGVRE